MADLIKVELQNGKQLRESLKTRSGEILTALSRKINYYVLRIQAKIVGNLASGNPIQSRRGMQGLAGSVRVTEATPSSLSASVEGAGGTTWYGKVHEYGGDRFYLIEPKVKKALAFESGGLHYIRKQVMRPPVPARPWFFPVFDEMKQEILDGVQGTVNEAIR